MTIPTRHFERIGDEQRRFRRTAADALDALRQFGGFKDQDCAQFRIGLLRLPSGKVVGLVNVIFDAPLRESGYAVSLPTSAQFRGWRDAASEPEVFEISHLDGAAVGGDGAVLMRHGARLRAVEVIPEHLPYEPTELDWRIVHHTISIAGAEEHCYRSLMEGLPPTLVEIAPDQRFLDCSKLSGLKLPPLKVIAADIASMDPTLKRLSQQKIADALSVFGMRVPTARPRRRRD